MSIGCKKILIVEDESSIAELIQQFLMSRFNTAWAATGREAISHVTMSYDSLDLILLDHNLPDRTGMEVLKQVKKLRPTLPVIMITAYGSEDIAADAFRNGAAEYLKKPFMKNELMEKIDSCLSKTSDFSARRASSIIHEEEAAFNLLNKARPRSRIQKALSYINENYSTKLTLDVVADKACMSRYHFSRSFKEEVGCTYQDYVNTLRITKAVEMLGERTHTITNIAFSVGYCDLTHFTRTFRKNIGYSPSDYRKKILKNDSK